MGDAVGKAGELLFGPGFVPPGDLGEEDWQREVRQAWRRRAMETHPDRAAALGRDRAELEREFQALAEACRVLCPPSRPAAAAPPPAEPSPRPAEAGGPYRRAETRRPFRRAEPQEPVRAPVDHLHRGGLPRRPLLFAEYLYYSGRVSWRNLVEAVSWQRRQRPPIGRIAVEWGHLSDEQVRHVLAMRRRGEAPKRFGECARDLGLLSGRQLLALLGRQRRLQRRIGEYFVEAGMVSPGEMAGLEADLVSHNARFRRER